MSIRDGIYRVSAEGGTPTRVTQADPAKREMTHLWPSFLPDGRRFLYTATSLDASGVRTTPSVYVASLDSTDVTLLARTHSKMVYSPPGHLLFVEEGTLLAQAFDPASVRLTGDPVKIAEGVFYYRTLGAAGFTVSDTGVLAYHGNVDTFQLVWHDRQGNATDSGWESRNFGSIRISPDAQSVAAEVIDPRTGTADIWIYDVARGAPIRFTTDLFTEGNPVWSPDGGRMMFRTDRAGAPDLVAKPLRGPAGEEVLLDNPEPLRPDDWSDDGKIAYTSITRLTGNDLWVLPLTGDRKPWAFSTSRFEEASARFSPDSKWLAFVSTESGVSEVYVAPVGTAGDRKRISDRGGTAPRWRRDGGELFYISADNRSLMAVPVDLRSTFSVGVPTRLFSIAEPAIRDRRSIAYDVTPDGQRFLISVAVGEPASSRITVVLNWSAALEHRPDGPG